MLLGLDVGDLGQAGHVAAPLEFGGEEDVDDGQGQVGAEDAGPQGEDVGVVVEPGQPCCGLVVAERRPDPADLVGGDVLALAAAPEDDGPIGVPRSTTARAAVAQNQG